MTDALVLILTHPADVHADAVQQHLDALGVRVHRTDTEWLGSRVPVTAYLRQGAVTGHRAGAELERVTCVWHRRPSDFAVADLDDDAELRAGIGGLLACLPHLNRPVDMAAALKPYQLVMAGRAGLRVPDSLVMAGSDPAEAMNWAGGEAGVVVKPMSRRRAGLVTADDRSGWARPVHLTQRRIAKVCDVRLTVVDEALFVVRIDSPHLDWRTDLDQCRYRVVDVPHEVAAGVRRLLGRLGLRYAAFDFAIDTAGGWWFLEINPNGQWLWIEQATGLPIAAAVAQALLMTPAALSLGLR